MNNDPVGTLQDSRSFQTFGFAMQIKQATTSVEVLLLLTYAVVMMFSLPFLFI